MGLGRGVVRVGVVRATVVFSGWSAWVGFDLAVLSFSVWSVGNVCVSY